MWSLPNVWLVPVLAIAALWLLHRAWRRLELSRAKHPSLAGHAKMSRRLAALLPYYGYDEQRVLRVRRRAGGRRRATARRASRAWPRTLRSRAPTSIAFSDSLASGLSDVQFTDAYRVPFQFRDYVREHLASRLRRRRVAWRRAARSRPALVLRPLGLVRREPVRLRLLQGVHRSRRETRRATLGPVLGPFHPVVRDNVERLKRALGPRRGVVPHVGHRSRHAGRAARAVPHAPLAHRAVLRRLSRLVGRRAAGPRQPPPRQRRLHAGRHERAQRCACSRRGATSPACS